LEILAVVRRLFRAQQYIQTVIDVTRLSLQVSTSSEKLVAIRNSVILELIESGVDFLMWITDLVEDGCNEQMCRDLLEIFGFFVTVKTSVLTENARFSEFCSQSLFHKDLQIRQSASRLFVQIQTHEYETVFLDLLKQSLKCNCDEYFALMSRLAEFNIQPAKLWLLVDGFLQENLIIHRRIESDTAPELDFEDLIGTVASDEFVHGMVNMLQKLALRIPDDYPDVNNLVDFLFDCIILNGQRYIPAPISLFPLLIILLKNETLIPKVIEKLIGFHNRLTPDPVPLALSSQNSLKGFINMGATCSLNSSLHQMIRIE
jgi:hypothetical protein